MSWGQWTKSKSKFFFIFDFLSSNINVIFLQKLIYGIKSITFCGAFNTSAWLESDTLYTTFPIMHDCRQACDTDTPWLTWEQLAARRAQKREGLINKHGETYNVLVLNFLQMVNLIKPKLSVGSWRISASLTTDSTVVTPQHFNIIRIYVTS